MRTFSIDSENNITVIASAKEAQAGESFGSEEEWHRLTADWPTSRLLDTCPFELRSPSRSLVSRA